VAREREILVLEDNPYGLLRYEGEPLPTLHSLDATAANRGGASDFVVYLGTFSKILSPGVRLGWAVAPRPVLEKLNLCKQGADLCSSPVTQLFVAAYFEESTRGGTRRGGGALSAARDEDEPLWLAHLDSLKALYRTRRDAMLDALAEHFGPAASWTKPQGGLFIWATLPEYIDTTDLLARALESEAVAFVPGRSAYLDGRGASSMRLNFAGVAEEDIREGIRRIGKVLREQVGLFGTLTGAEPASGAPVAQRSDAGMAEVVELPRREQRDASRHTN
jgi:2-aminoadipate transaminase